MEKQKTDYSYLSKYRTALMGLAAILTMLWHAKCASDYDRLGVFRLISAIGSCGINIFVLVSGLGCYYSLSRSGSLSAFYRKRLLTVVPVSLLIICAYAAARVCLNMTSALSAFREVFVLGSDNPAWYVPFSIISYLLFPLFFHFVRKTPLLIILGVILLLIAVTYLFAKANYEAYESVEATLTRIPLFLFGTLCGKWSSEKRKAGRLWYLVFPSAGLFLTGLLLRSDLSYVCYRYGSILLGVLICFIAVAAAEALKNSFFGRAAAKTLAFFAGMSLEIYLTHNLAKSIFESLGLLDLRMYALILAASIAVSYPLSKLRRRIADAHAHP